MLAAWIFSIACRELAEICVELWALIKIDLLKAASLQETLPITNMEECGNITLICGSYSLHFKL